MNKNWRETHRALRPTPPSLHAAPNGKESVHFLATCLSTPFLTFLSAPFVSLALPLTFQHLFSLFLPLSFQHPLSHLSTLPLSLATFLATFLATCLFSRRSFCLLSFCLTCPHSSLLFFFPCSKTGTFWIGNGLSVCLRADFLTLWD